MFAKQERNKSVLHVVLLSHKYIIMATNSQAYGSKASKRREPCFSASCEATDHLYTFLSESSMKRKWIRFVTDKPKVGSVVSCCNG